MQPVVFVKYFDKGSTILGAHMMQPALEELGVECRCLYADEITDVRDSILVFIKKGRLDHLLRSRLQGNLNVLDVQDTLCFKRRLKNRMLFQGIIFRSQRPLDDHGDSNGRCTKIYLPWNVNYRPNRVEADELRLAYFGDPRSFSYWDELDGVPCIPETRFFDEAYAYNCHISIRTQPRDVLYKPTCKVSTAAACNAVLITTRDEASVEVLGEAYPFYTRSDPESVRRAIEFAQASFGGPLWQEALEQMRAIREEHSLARVAEHYRDYFERLSRSGLAAAA
jgi:hypothetical protein